MSTTYSKRCGNTADDLVCTVLGTLFAEIIMIAIDAIASELKGEVKKSFDYC